MELKDLFVSHKQVEPVSFSFQKPQLPTLMYLNLERAQKVASSEQEDSHIPSPSTQIRNWKVNSTKPLNNATSATNINNEENTEKTYLDNYSIEQNPSNAENNSQFELPSNPVIKETALLKKYRSSQDYVSFKKELDTFINNNPQYKDIKDSLDYLAALESRYQMGVENYQGSKALGWFQFMDNTRHDYNNQSREEFAKDPQAQLKAAAQHYTSLQKQIKGWGGDPDDFVTMYGAWWRPDSARIFIQDPTHNHSTIYNEDFQKIRRRAQDLLA